MEEHAGERADLCRRFEVKRLELFRSVVGDRFDPDRSDFDFLVEFDFADPVEHAKAHFGLLSALTDLFSREVDLVEIRAAMLAAE